MRTLGMDVKTLSVHRAGIATFLRAVLPELMRAMPRVEFVAFGPAAALAQLPVGTTPRPVEMWDWAGKARLPLYDQVQLRMAARGRGVHLFYSPYFDAPVRLGTPTVVTMHDAVHFRFPHLYPWPLRAYYRGLMRDHGRHAAAVVTDSHFSKAELVELLDIDAAHVHVVHLALPQSFQAPADGRAEPNVLARYGLPQEYVLYTGGVEPRKNLERLFRAYAAWLKRRHDAPALVLTGRVTSYEPCLAALPPHAAARVHRCGPVSDADLPHVYAGALAVVYPSLYEGFGFPLLEAMTAGVPIACARRGSLPEIAGAAAVYFDPEDPEAIVDALEAVTSDQTLRAKLVWEGRHRVSDFSLTATAAAIARVLMSVLEAR